MVDPSVSFTNATDYRRFDLSSMDKKRPRYVRVEHDLRLRDVERICCDHHTSHRSTRRPVNGHKVCDFIR